MAKNSNGMEEKQREKFTVQGRDTPVPVVDRSGRAGFPRPLASDCYVVPASDQAGLQGATGKETNPFERRSSIARTPPRPRAMSLTDLSPKSSQQNAKRKRTDNSMFPVERKDKKDVITKLLEIIDEINLDARALNKTANESSNTKKEIREIAGKLNRWTEKLLGYDIQDTLRKLRDQDSTNTLNRTDNRDAKPNTCDGSTQTDERFHSSIECQTNFQSRDQKKLDLARIRDFISRDLNQEELKQIIEQDWEEQAYKQTKVTKATIHQTNEVEDLVVFIDAKKADKSLVERITKRTPEVQKLILENKPEPGKIVCITNSSKLLFGEGNEPEQSAEKRTVMIGVSEEENIYETFYDVYNATKKMAIVAQQNMKRHFTVLPQKEWNDELCRRTLECALWQSGVTVTVVSQPRQARATAKPPGEAIIIETGDRSYADLLRVVKEKIQDKKMDDNIKTASKSRDGHLVLKMNEGTKETASIASALKTIDGGVVLRTLGEREPTMVLHIKDMDAITTRAEIEAAIRDFMIKERIVGHVIVTNLRPGYRETQVATTIVSKETGTRLSQIGGIRIGLVTCRIRERVKIKTCFRCWDIGHISSDCKGTDRSKLCKNCGEGGHFQRECKENPRCFTCNQDGHRTQTMRCPKYRKEIMSASRPQPIFQNGYKTGN